MSEYIHIGKLVASFGLTGELILKHELGKNPISKGSKWFLWKSRKAITCPIL